MIAPKHAPTVGRQCEDGTQMPRASQPLPRGSRLHRQPRSVLQDYAWDALQSSPLPIAANRSKQSSRPGLSPDLRYSRCEAWSSLRQSPRPQLYQKLLQEISSYLLTVLRGRSDVINRLCFRKQRCPRRLNRLRVGGLARQGRFDLIEPRWKGCKASSRDANLAHLAVAGERRSSQGNFRDGHGAASANLSQILPVLRKPARQMNGVEQFIGGHRILLVASVEG